MRLQPNILTKLPPTGIKSIDTDGTDLLLGDAQIGNIYRLSNTTSNTLSLITQTGEMLPVSNLINVFDGNALFSMGGKLNLLLSEATLIELANTVSNVAATGNTLTIMDLGDEEITDIIKIEDTGTIVLSTSHGRILSCTNEVINAYLTGQRTIYADVLDGMGFSNTASSSVLYALHNRIAEINPAKEITKWQFVVDPTAISVDTITGVFTSPIMYVKEDFGFWKELFWNEVKPLNTDIVVSLRTASSSEDLLTHSWNYSFSSNIGEVGTISRPLNDILLIGQYLQIKITMTTSAQFVTPIVSRVSMVYSTKQASYFFTTVFSLAKAANASTGMLVGTITQPQNTEVKFGVANKDSTDWQDYQVVDSGKLFKLANPEAIKVGIKFISYDTNVASVAQFAIVTGSENSQILGVLG